MNLNMFVTLNIVNANIIFFVQVNIVQMIYIYIYKMNTNTGGMLVLKRTFCNEKRIYIDLFLQVGVPTGTVFLFFCFFLRVLHA